jgi:hypothetical protein
MTIIEFAVVAVASGAVGAVFGAAIKAWFTKKVAAPVAAEVTAAKTVVADVKKVV